MIDKVAIIGYSGHAFVVLDSLVDSSTEVVGYFEIDEKRDNPFNLTYLGKDTPKGVGRLGVGVCLFAAIGDNRLRREVLNKLSIERSFIAIVDQAAQVSPRAKLNPGIFVAKGASIGPITEIGEGAIINTSAIIEHECKVGPFAHVAPGAVLAGNVNVGAGAFIGANSVVRQGISIGEWATIGAGAVVVSNVSDNSVVVGNPAKPI